MECRPKKRKQSSERTMGIRALKLKCNELSAQVELLKVENYRLRQRLRNSSEMGTNGVEAFRNPFDFVSSAPTDDTRSDPSAHDTGGTFSNATLTVEHDDNGGYIKDQVIGKESHIDRQQWLREQVPALFNMPLLVPLSGLVGDADTGVASFDDTDS